MTACPDRTPPVRRLTLTILLLCVSPGFVDALDDTSYRPPQTGDRPRIGLVLGGGGAKGGAHVGVLKVLDELRIPVDCVVGTSMGALVGGTFASGVPASELESRLGKIDWSATIGSEGRRAAQSMQRKITGITYSNNIEFSIRDHRLHGDGGFIPAQNVEAQIRLLIGTAREITDFDELPLPFRAVATDLAASQMAVLGDGDMAEAMRASMAVPGLFAPVVVGDQVLADGGMVRNLPVDVARALCGDVIIAVQLASPSPAPDELRSLFTAAGRSIDTVIEANEKTQLALLDPADVPIIVPVGNIRSTDFDQVMETVPLGETAARRVADQLNRYALPEQEYRAWREATTRPVAPLARITGIDFLPLGHTSADYLATRMRIRTGDEATPEQLEADLNRLFESGDFDRIDYRLLPAGHDAYHLVIDAREKRGRAGLMRFDLGVAGSAGGDVLFVLRADHRKEWLNARGGQWRNALQVGQISSFETAFYQPLDTAQRYYLEPSLAVRRSLENVFIGGNRAASYRLLEAGMGMDLGVNLGNHARMYTGVRVGIADFTLDTGTLSPLDEDRSRDHSVLVGGLLDTRDAAYLPTRGSYAQFEYRHSSGWLGGEQSYTQVEGVLGRAIQWREHVVMLAAGAGHTLDGDLPRHRDFRIGGARSFPAVQRGELRGEGYWSGSATWMLRLRDIQALFGQVFYGGLGLHALRLLDPIDGGPDRTVLGASFTLGARTPVGPLLLTLGAADNDNIQLHVALGRPINEGSLLDRLQ